MEGEEELGGGSGCWEEGRGGEGFQRDGGDVVERDEADAVPCAEDLGVGLDEYVPADAAAFGALGVQEGGDGKEVGEGGGREALGLALREGEGGLHARVAQGVDGGGVAAGVEDVQTFADVGALAHGKGFGRVFLGVAAEPGVHAHDAGEAAGGVVVVAAAGGEQGVGGASGGDLQGHEGFEGSECFFAVGLRGGRWGVGFRGGGGLALFRARFLSSGGEFLDQFGGPVEVHADVEGGPAAVVAGYDEGAGHAFGVGVDVEDAHGCDAYGAIEAVSLTPEISVSWGFHDVYEGERGMKPYLPVAFVLDHHARDLEQAARTVPADYLFDYAPWTADLLAVFAVEEVLHGI